MIITRLLNTYTYAYTNPIRIRTIGNDLTNGNLVRIGTQFAKFRIPVCETHKSSSHFWKRDDVCDMCAEWHALIIKSGDNWRVLHAATFKKHGDNGMTRCSHGRPVASKPWAMNRDESHWLVWPGTLALIVISHTRLFRCFSACFSC